MVFLEVGLGQDTENLRVGGLQVGLVVELLGAGDAAVEDGFEALARDGEDYVDVLQLELTLRHVNLVLPLRRLILQLLHLLPRLEILNHLRQVPEK